MEAPTFFWWVDIAYGVLALCIGAFAFAVGWRRLANNLLFWVLLLEGFGYIAFGITLAAQYELAEFSNAMVAGADMVSTITFRAILPIYLLFVSQVAPTPWNKWLRSRGAVIGTLVISLLAMVVVAAFGDQSVQWQAAAAVAASSIVYVAVLAMAVSFLRSSRANSSQRTQAWWVFGAVLARDIPWLLFTPMNIFLVANNRDLTANAELWVETLWTPFYLIFVVMAGLGILRGQLVDLDNKIHFTISKTTIAAVFIAVFVGVQTAVSEFVADSWGLAAAGVAAGGLFFALAPLQNFAERVADKTVPQGRSSSKMSKQERESFYREQVEIAYSDGSIGTKERRSLKAIRERLGLSAAAALGIEEKVAS